MVDILNNTTEPDLHLFFSKKRTGHESFLKSSSHLPREMHPIHAT